MQIRWICSNTSWNLECIPPYSMNKIALNKRSLHNYTPYLPHSWSHAVPALPEQNSMPIGWGNLGDLSYWLKIPQICCCCRTGCLEPRWGRKVPQPIPQNFAESDSIYVRGGAAIRDINGAVCISLLTNHGMSQMLRDSNFMQNGTRRHPSSQLAASEPWNEASREC